MRLTCSSTGEPSPCTWAGLPTSLCLIGPQCNKKQHLSSSYTGHSAFQYLYLIFSLQQRWDFYPCGTDVLVRLEELIWIAPGHRAGNSAAEIWGLVCPVASFFRAKDSWIKRRRRRKKDSWKGSTNEKAAHGCPRILETELMHVAILMCMALCHTSPPQNPVHWGLTVSSFSTCGNWCS